MKRVSYNQIKDNFDKIFSDVLKGEQITITKDNKDVAILTKIENQKTSVADELLGMFKTDREIEPDKEKDEYFKEKYKL